jgi:hypothetical protein
MKRTAVAIVMVGLVLGACSSGGTIPGPTTTVARPTVTVTATRTVDAPRTSSSPAITVHCLTADQASLIVSRQRGGRISIENHRGFACADGWAYVNFVGPNSPNAATVDLQFVNGKWVIGDRLIACGDRTTAPAMVPALVHGGCGN